jgi:hypothetical protein
MIDIEPIKAQLAKDIGGYICLHRDDMAGLVEEVERLRGERAAVVAWLRGKGNDPTTFMSEAIALACAASIIERGEHRKETP